MSEAVRLPDGLVYGVIWHALGAWFLGSDDRYAVYAAYVHAGRVHDAHVARQLDRTTGTMPEDDA